MRSRPARQGSTYCTAQARAKGEVFELTKTSWTKGQGLWVDEVSLSSSEQSGDQTSASAAKPPGRVGRANPIDILGP